MAPLPLLAAFAALFPTVVAPESSFTLTTNHRDTIRLAHLTCGPAGGTHGNAHHACAALSEVDGRIDELRAAPVSCTMEYDPVTVTATGTWRGERRRFTQTFENPCVLRAGTGHVFDF
ncbi:SSI family serine proteinase inhibitor [Saccharothrix obliqua]|uniref:SSI family serine proteinase inhibitor n=1 Tax=Saccharothrix obliqua TaxID=2861747 RepID=UPI001C5D9A3C|nr:SSI family serine proteinase inhibitor [Saccharothrix obliqua]MBW4716318.1 subtilase-type protease inhibitor [Saccharothrix obliqua]